MKTLTNHVGYVSPETVQLDILSMSVLCQSDKDSYDATLEDMTENEYTFTF